MEVPEIYEGIIEIKSIARDLVHVQKLRFTQTSFNRSRWRLCRYAQQPCTGRCK